MLILLLLVLILCFMCIRENNQLQHQLKTQRPKIVLHVVDNAGGELVGKITDKEIIEGRYTLTVGAYGKFLVTKEQYEAIKVGDPIPEYLKGRKQ
ncbi:MAG: DUF1372 family protein [Streptococcus hyointestinalis]|nr:DUF1372 family protein [Streptococcus hyointestinalis]MDD6383947.1 DUF1372 family protein [Streptococcus hyointestinalis]